MCRVCLILLFCIPAFASYDLSMITPCKNVAKGIEKFENFKNHPLVLKMKEGMKERFAFSEEQIKNNLKNLMIIESNYIPQIKLRWKQLVKESIQFLPASVSIENVKVNFVCGGPWDAYVLVFDSPEIFIDLTIVNKDKIFSIVKHELWHVGYKMAYPKRWKDKYISDDVKMVQKLAYVVINEGIGHYFSFQSRVEPKIDYGDWDKRVKTIFKLFNESYGKLIKSNNKKYQNELLWHSHAGVPFWKKWGAAVGAIMIYRLKKDYGVKKIKQLLQQGSCRVIKSYQDLALEKKYDILPSDFVRSCE